MKITAYTSVQGTALPVRQAFYDRAGDRGNGLLGDFRSSSPG